MPDETFPYEWAQEQMDEVKTPAVERVLITKLLEVFWPYAGSEKLNVSEMGRALIQFTELALGHSLVADEEEPDAGVWVPARPGSLVIRDEVRIKPDAYAGPAGVAHNGRIGTITAIRYGDIYVRYTDGKGQSSDLNRHAPNALEKRVRR